MRFGITDDALFPDDTCLVQQTRRTIWTIFIAHARHKAMCWHPDDTWCCRTSTRRVVALCICRWANPPQERLYYRCIPSVFVETRSRFNLCTQIWVLLERLTFSADYIKVPTCCKQKLISDGWNQHNLCEKAFVKLEHENVWSTPRKIMRRPCSKAEFQGTSCPNPFMHSNTSQTTRKPERRLNLENIEGSQLDSIKVLTNSLTRLLLFGRRRPHTSSSSTASSSATFWVW